MDKLKQSKRYANVSHSEQLYEVDPEAKRDRMWKLEKKVDQETGNTFEPKLIANYKPQIMHSLVNEEEADQNQKKIYELGFEERNKEY